MNGECTCTPRYAIVYRESDRLRAEREGAQTVQTVAHSGPIHDASCAARETWVYAPGSYSDRNTGRACWSCAGLMTHAPASTCIYPESHRR